MSPDLIRKEIKQRKKIVLSKNAHIHQNNKCKQSVVGEMSNQMKNKSG